MPHFSGPASAAVGGMINSEMAAGPCTTACSDPFVGRW
nr:hypothetical protein [Kibdelosporangium sp. MJ126-NF4]